MSMRRESAGRARHQPGVVRRSVVGATALPRSPLPRSSSGAQQQRGSAASKQAAPGCGIIWTKGPAKQAEVVARGAYARPPPAGKEYASVSNQSKIGRLPDQDTRGLFTQIKDMTFISLIDSCVASAHEAQVDDAPGVGVPDGLVLGMLEKHACPGDPSLERNTLRNTMRATRRLACYTRAHTYDPGNPIRHSAYSDSCRALTLSHGQPHWVNSSSARSAAACGDNSTSVSRRLIPSQTDPSCACCSFGSSTPRSHCL
jgi:hypothetical protein